MAPGGLCEDLDFDRLEAQQLAVADQIARMPVVAGVVDGVPDVVQQPGELDELPSGYRQAELRRDRVEELAREPRHLLAVRVVAGEASGQGLDGAPAHR